MNSVSVTPNHSTLTGTPRLSDEEIGEFEHDLNRACINFDLAGSNITTWFDGMDGGLARFCVPLPEQTIYVLVDIEQELWYVQKDLDGEVLCCPTQCYLYHETAATYLGNAGIALCFASWFWRIKTINTRMSINHLWVERLPYNKYAKKYFGFQRPPASVGGQFNL